MAISFTQDLVVFTTNHMGKEFIELAQRIGQYLNQAIAQGPVNWPSIIYFH